MRDLASNISITASIVPAVLTATTTGSAIDTLNYGSLAVAITTGAIVSSGNFTPKLTESDDNVTYTDVAAADLIGTFPSALSASSTIKVSYKGFKRYVKPVLTLNSGTSIAASAVAIKGNAAQRPVA